MVAFEAVREQAVSLHDKVVAKGADVLNPLALVKAAVHALELEANVFAREFLLPRALAKGVHVDQKQTAAQISTRTGLPINLVRQQLLDALLLPRVAKKPKPQGAVRREPDDSQKRAIAHRGV